MTEGLILPGVTHVHPAPEHVPQRADPGHAFTVAYSGDPTRPYSASCSCGQSPVPLATDEIEPWMRLHWRGWEVTR